MQKNWLASALLFMLLAVIIIIESNAPKPINWQESFDYKDKNPYGLYILYERILDLFPQQTLTLVQASPYEQELSLQEANPAYQPEKPELLKEKLAYNWLIIHKEITLSKVDTEVLLRLAKSGMHILLAAEVFSPALQEGLGIETAPSDVFHSRDSTALQTTQAIQAGLNNWVAYKKNTVDFYFNQFDKRRSHVLVQNQKRQPVVLAIPQGRGQIIVCSTPLMFTNYNLLQTPNRALAEQVLSYLPPKHQVLWDEYQRYALKGQEKSIFRYILKEPTLRWAFYITLLALGLFVVFQGKRKQRAMPIIKPPKNTSLEFIQLMGRLYFLYRDHKNIAEKKIQYFLEQLRTSFYIKTQNIDAEWVATLSAKSGVEIAFIQKLFDKVAWVQAQQRISENDLWQLHNLIEEFKQKATLYQD